MNISSSDKAKLIAVTGGIGAGKSVVCKILRAMGYVVYDCDSECRRIMDTDLWMKQLIASRIGATCLNDDMTLNRAEISRLVFSDDRLLQELNNITHAAVRKDILEKAGQGEGLMFVETAILYESGIDRMVDEVWIVDAPESLRVSRVMRRNNMTCEQVQSRIDAQKKCLPEHCHPYIKYLINDGVEPLLPQVEGALHRVDVIV